MNQRRTVPIFAAGLSLVLGALIPLLNAQSDRGIITGTVTDQTGAAIVGVSVAATNKETTISSRTTTGAKRRLNTVTLLPAGTYEVSAEHSGFKKFVGRGIVVQIGQTVRVDIPMELGRVRETVEVRAEEPLLLPNTSDLGTVIARQEFQDLPLIGQREVRNPTFFMILVPGVTGRGTATVTMEQFNMRNLSTTVNGSQSGQH